jgi:hypothetical protein
MCDFANQFLWKYCASELNEKQDLNNKLMLVYIELFIKLRFVKL